MSSLSVACVFELDRSALIHENIRPLTAYYMVKRKATVFQASAAAAKRFLGLTVVTGLEPIWWCTAGPHGQVVRPSTFIGVVYDTIHHGDIVKGTLPLLRFTLHFESLTRMPPAWLKTVDVDRLLEHARKESYYMLTGQIRRLGTGGLVYGELLPGKARLPCRIITLDEASAHDECLATSTLTSLRYETAPETLYDAIMRVRPNLFRTRRLPLLVSGGTIVHPALDMFDAWRLLHDNDYTITIIVITR